MKTLGRMMIILLAAVLIGGAMTLIVNHNGSAAPAGPERRDGAAFGIQGPATGNELGGFLPEGRRSEGHEGGEGGWLGILRNLGIISVLIMLVTIPKKLARKNAIPTAVKIE